MSIDKIMPKFKPMLLYMWCDTTAYLYDFLMEPCVVWEIPSSQIGEPDCRDVIIEKRCSVGTHPIGNYVKIK